MIENILQTAITDKEFRLIRDLVYNNFGINLTEQKRSLVVGRLQNILRKEKFSTFNEFYQYVVTDATGRALDKLVNRISTNYTYFNREKAHFDFLSEQALPDIIAGLTGQNKRDLRVWSAGCSSGEEPYMLAILMREYLGAEYGLWDTGVLATDISDRVLSKAKGGLYFDEQVKRLSRSLINKYFRKLNDDQWTVVDQIKNDIVYRRFNLMSKQFPFKKPFHIIFCRNVMIYFDQQTRDALVRRFHQFMEPGGYFFIGHSETLGRQQTLFKYLMPALYQRI